MTFKPSKQVTVGDDTVARAVIGNNAPLVIIAGPCAIESESHALKMAEQIRATFEVFAARHGLDQGLPPLSTDDFRPPIPSSGQLRLFA